MYRVESIHFGTPKEEFISPVKGGKMNINPITMTRMVSKFYSNAFIRNKKKNNNMLKL
jgi:hypothetical protein